MKFRIALKTCCLLPFLLSKQREENTGTALTLKKKLKFAPLVNVRTIGTKFSKFKPVYKLVIFAVVFRLINNYLIKKQISALATSF